MCMPYNVYHKCGGQQGYKGHVLNLPQDFQGFIHHLPQNINDLPFLLLCCNGDNSTHIDLQVRRHVVMQALQWL